MWKKTTVIAVGGIILIAVIVGWAFFASSPRGQLSTPTIQNVPYEVRVETQPTKLSTGSESIIRVHVSQAGKPVDVDAIGRLLHVIIVSANLRDTYHTYSPKPEGQGVYSVEHTFTEPGLYRIWTELDDLNAPQRHDQHAEQIAYASVAVMGEPLSQASLVESPEATVGPYRARLLGSRFEAGKPATLRVEVRDVAGKPIQLFVDEPFLYFISGENFSFFRHGHGMTLPDGIAGLENTFPVAGRYVFWIQLQLADNSELQVPFLITAE